MSDAENETQSEWRSKLEQMWEQLNGRSRSTAENHIEEYNESIVKEIVNGDLELSNRMIELKNVRNKHSIEMSVRDEILKRAEREKSQLENKLKYISHSINTLREAESSPKFAGSTSQRYGTTEEGEQAKVDLKERAIKFKKEMEERSKRLAAMKREADLKDQLKENQRKQNEQQREKIQSQKRKQELQENIKRIRERMEKREMEVKDGNERIKDLLAKEKMYEKLEVGFMNRQHSLLEERKRKLSEIRNLYRPLDHDELASHQQRFLEYQKEKEQLRERQRKMAQRSYEVPYESVFYKRIKEKQEEQADAGADRAKMEKIKMFAQHVKDNFKPEVDPNKKKELEDILRKEQQDHQQREQKERQLLDKAKKKGLQYLQQLKSMPRPILMPTLRSSSPKAASSTPRTQYKNYITHSEHKANPWKRILSSSKDSSDSKALRVYYQSMRIQQQLKRKEEMTKLNKSKDCEDIDQGYYEMIKAKLQVLDSK